MKKIFVSFMALIFGSFPFFARAQWDPGNYDETELPAAPISHIISNLLDWLLAGIGVIAIIAFLVSAVMYFVSAGDKEQIEKAKKAMVAAITGVIVALVGLVVLRAVDAFLNAESF